MSHNAGFSLKHSYYSSSSVVLLVVMGNNNERSSASMEGAKRRVPLKIRAVCNRSSQLCQKLSLFSHGKLRRTFMDPRSTERERGADDGS